MPYSESIHVIKLGGSLLDLPDLHRRFEGYFAQQPISQPLLVVGGGQAADTVRRFDRDYQFTERCGHRLAVRAMRFNTHLVMAALAEITGVQLVGGEAGCTSAWDQGAMAVMDPIAWLDQQESRGVTIPRQWSFTSDSIAAHAAKTLNAQRLTLLKSALPQPGSSIVEAAQQGIVDDQFPRASAGIARIELVNLRPKPFQVIAWPT